MKPALNRFTFYIGLALCLALGMPGTVFAGPNSKCGTNMTFSFVPGTTVDAGTLVTMTEEIKTTTLGSGTQDCELTVGSYVDDGNAKIQAMRLGASGPPMSCVEEDNGYCTAGDQALLGNECTTSTECDGGSPGVGVCTTVALFDLGLLQSENPTDGFVQYIFDTTGFGNQVAGFRAQYSGTGEFEGAPSICTDVAVNEVESCSGATISIDRASGPGAPTPGGSYAWTFRVTVHACEALVGVTAQGGTNGWAQLVNRSATSLHPDTGSAAIKKANNKTDVILWTIGDMNAGDTAHLVVDLSGSVPAKTPDCQVRYLSGPWSALFSTDGITFEKSEYTGRVSVEVDSNGNPNDCSP